MSRWRIACLGTTEISLNPGVLLYALYAVAIGHGKLMLLATLSILLHEAAHALTAAAWKCPPSSVELTPLGAVMRLEAAEKLAPMRKMSVYLAGPGATFALAFVAIRLTQSRMIQPETGYLLFICNLSILLLNLLPVLPLDGGQIFSLLLAIFLPLGRVNRIMRGLGCLVGVGLIGVNIYASWRLGGWNLSLAFAGCSMLYSAYAATATQAAAELRYLMDRKIRLERKQHMVIRPICALHTTPLRRLVRSLPQGRMAEFVCIETGSMNILGRIFESQLIQCYLNKPESTLREAIRSSAPRAPSGTSGTI